MTRVARGFLFALVTVVASACTDAATAPNAIGGPSLTTAAEVTADSTEVVGMEVDEVDMDGEVNPDGSSTSVSMSLSGDDVGVNGYPVPTCGTYSECVDLCRGVRTDFNNEKGNFWRADDEFWGNLLTGRHYLNRLAGGPIDQMRSSFGKLSNLRNQYRANMCSDYL